MEAIMKVVKASSFTNFVYPFTFNPAHFDVRALEIDGIKWNSPKRDILVWARADFFKEDLLPHINRYLNAESGNPSTAYLWNMNDDALSSASGLSSGKNSRWIMERTKGDIAFSVEWIQIALFRTGVGFLTIRAIPESDDLNVWFDFIHHFRFISGSRSLMYSVEKRTGLDKDTGKGIMTRFFPGPGCPEKKSDGHLGSLIELILVNCTSGDKLWWRDIFVQGQLIPFSAVFIEDTGETHEIMDVIYRLRNFFHSQQNFKPSKGDLSFYHPSMLEYGENQWFVTTLEGGAFICVDPPHSQFFEGTLTTRLRNQYFLLFLLTLQQRFGLLSISDRVSEYWLMNSKIDNAENVKGIRGRLRKLFPAVSGVETIRIKSFEFIRGILLEFTARGHFTQVTQREKQHKFYMKCQDVFQINSLYTEVNDEVREMHEFLSDRQSRRLEERINRLGAIIGVPSIVVGLFSLANNFNDDNTYSLDMITFIILAVTIPLSLIILWLMKR